MFGGRLFFTVAAGLQQHNAIHSIGTTVNIIIHGESLASSSSPAHTTHHHDTYIYECVMMMMRTDSDLWTWGKSLMSSGVGGLRAAATRGQGVKEYRKSYHQNLRIGSLTTAHCCHMCLGSERALLSPAHSLALFVTLHCCMIIILIASAIVFEPRNLMQVISHPATSVTKVFQLEYKAIAWRSTIPPASL